MGEFLARLEQAAELRAAERGESDPLFAHLRSIEKRMRHLSRRRTD